MTRGSTISPNGRPNPDDWGLSRTFNLYRDLDPQELSYDACCAAIVRMQETLINLGKASNRATVSSDGVLLEFDPKEFAPEINILSRFVQRLSYSPAFIRWVSNRRDSFIADCQEDHYLVDLKRQWRMSSAHDRLSILSVFANRHADIFTHALRKLPAPRVTKMNDPRILETGLIGRVVEDFDKLRQGIMPAVQISARLLADESADLIEALRIIQHEMLHWDLFALAMGAYSGDINNGNPLYHDAKMQLAKIRRGAIISHVIYEPYREQPEEEICYKTGNFPSGVLESTLA